MQKTKGKNKLLHDKGLCGDLLVFAKQPEETSGGYKHQHKLHLGQFYNLFESLNRARHGAPPPPYFLSLCQTKLNVSWLKWIEIKVVSAHLTLSDKENKCISTKCTFSINLSVILLYQNIGKKISL